MQQRYKSRFTDGVLDEEEALAEAEKHAALAIQEVENRKQALAAAKMQQQQQPQQQRVSGLKEMGSPD